MGNPYDSACTIKNIWREHLHSNVDPLLSFVFKTGMEEIKSYCQEHDYSKAMPIAKTMVKGFNPDFYKNESWGKHADVVLEKLKGLESSLQELI
jgi:hypothetical protein